LSARGARRQALPLSGVIAPKPPTLEDSAVSLGKLKAHPGSIVLIALESFPNSTECRVTWGWFSAAERRTLRAALERARKGRSLSLPHTVAASGNGFILPVAGTKGNRAGRRARRGFLDATLKRPGHSVPGNISPSYVKKRSKAGAGRAATCCENKRSGSSPRRTRRSGSETVRCSHTTKTDFGSRADNKAGHRDVGSSKACGNRNRLRICSLRSFR
jgi:hypothetical protein